MDFDPMDLEAARLQHYQSHRVYVRANDKEIQRRVLGMLPSKVSQESEKTFYDAWNTITNVVTGLNMRVERDGDVINNLSAAVAETLNMQAGYADMQCTLAAQTAEIDRLRPLAADHNELVKVRQDNAGITKKLKETMAELLVEKAKVASLNSQVTSMRALVNLPSQGLHLELLL
jgi:hypothetical protein